MTETTTPTSRSEDPPGQHARVASPRRQKAPPQEFAVVLPPHAAKWLLRSALALVALVALCALAYLADMSMQGGRVLPGVDVEGTEVGGLTPAEANERLRALAEKYERTPLRLQVAETSADIVPSDLGYDIDVAAVVRDAYSVGRSGDPTRRFVDWLGARLFGRRVAWQALLDTARAAERLEAIGFKGKAQPQEPLVEFQGTKATVTKPVTGRGVEVDKAITHLRQDLLRLPRHTMRLPVRDVPPHYDLQDAEAAAKRVEPWLASSLTVEYGKDSAVLPASDIAALLRPDPGATEYRVVVDQQRLVEELRRRFPPSGEAPVDARFDIVEGKAVILAGKAGFGCCAAESARLVEQALARAGAERRVRLHEGEVPPRRSEADLAMLGVRDLLGEFTTKYASGQARVENIHKISDMMRGVIVAPGERFSLNKFVGERKRKDGWVAAGSFVDGDYSDSVGGGISQFATTLYNALYFSGVQIDKHQPHSIWLRRYPKGREATLGWPKPDLVFTNDTPGALLVWASYSDSTVTVSIWGTSDGRKAEASEPKATWSDGCTIVKVVRTIRWPDGREEREPYTTYYHPPGESC